ncbi:MAG: hypothetical protein WBM07_09765 [Chitinivibrionales bacterium]
MVNKIRQISVCFIAIISTQITNANPISPCEKEFNPISEIQIIDSTHWFIEINGNLCGVGAKWDSIYIGICKTDTSSLPDTFLTPNSKILFDSISAGNYLAVLSGTNFPSFKFLKSSKIIIRTAQSSFSCNWFINCGNQYESSENILNIDSTLHPYQSLVRLPTEYWYNANDFGGPPDEELAKSFVYAKCDSPTIGKINNFKGILNIVTGRIKDPKNNVLHGITLNNNPPSLGGGFLNPSDKVVLTSTHTDSAGRFSIQQIASFPSIFTFSDSIDGNAISKKVLGPFYGEPDSIIDVGDFVLDDYAPTRVVNKHFEQNKNAISSLNVLGVFSFINQKGVKIVIANNTNASSPIAISILTVKGQKIRDMSAVISGAGTTTINWDGNNAFGKRVLAGTYIVTILSNNSQVKRSYVVIQQ